MHIPSFIIFLKHIIKAIVFVTDDTQNVGSYDGDVSETKVLERQKKIHNLIKESPTITGRQMSKMLSVI